MKTLLAAVISVAAVSVPALAQDFSATPSYGSVNLNAGFTPDPYTVRLTSGGSRPASNISSSCRGWIANAPDFSVYYTAGSTFDLTIGAVSETDTTLVVNGPTGNWFCDDDSGAVISNIIQRQKTSAAAENHIIISTNTGLPRKDGSNLSG